MRIFKVLMFLLACSPGFAQVQLVLKSPPFSARNTEGYFIDKVLDERDKKNTLGSVFLRDRSKTDLIIKGGISEAFGQLSRKHIKMDASGGLPIVIKVKVLSIAEQSSGTSLIEGQLKMEIEAYTVFNNREEKLCTARSNSRFSRSYGTAHEDSYEPLLSKMWFSCLSYVDTYISQNKQKLEPFNAGSQIVILPFQTENSGDTVHYASRKVNWNDFKGPIRGKSHYGAAIFTSIGLKTRLRIVEGKLTAYITPQVFMIPSQSWARVDARDQAALEHEQIHFDITQVIMNRLINKLRNIEANSIDDLNSMIQYEYLESFKEMNRMQEQYDNESDHNLYKPGQLKWKLQVKEWLSPGNS